MELLHIGFGAGVASTKPLSQLKNIVGLSVENFQKLSDYGALSKLTTLESLNIEGDGVGPQYIKIDNIYFINGMKQLRFFRLLTERLQSKNYTPILELENLEPLSLSLREIE